jgi:hypothetical protein
VGLEENKKPNRLPHPKRPASRSVKNFYRLEIAGNPKKKQILITLEIFEVHGVSRIFTVLSPWRKACGSFF